MDRLSATFQMQRHRLTCCFRCPRRIVFTASQINRGLRAAPDAVRGRVDVVLADGTDPYQSRVGITHVVLALDHVL